MIELILAAITAIATLTYFLWKRYGSKNAEILKLKKRRTAIKKEIKQLREEIRLAKPEDEDELIARHHNLDIERLQITDAIRDLRS